MRHHAFRGEVSREELHGWYRLTRRRTREIFALIQREEAFYTRPIPLRHPPIFYLGHIPGFSVNTLVKQALGRPGLAADLESLFARGIDPDSRDGVYDPAGGWPSISETIAFADACDELVEDALLNDELERSDRPLLVGGEAVFTILEHELMHQETLLYLLHNLPFESKRQTATPDLQLPAASSAMGERVPIPPGTAHLGAAREGLFGWDNEFPRVSVDVPAFVIDACNVTNGEYLEYVESTGATPPHFWRQESGRWLWRGLLAERPLPLDAPVYVTHREATSFARWRGARLPTEAEFHRAAFGSPEGNERPFPWGDDRPRKAHGNFGFIDSEPRPVGSHPAGVSAWGVHDLVGNGWEWTTTLFGPFPGFEPMPSYALYSTDFFDDAHYVLKGASPATARELIRPSFRNWFRDDYPYVYATFRCVYEA